MLRDGPKPAKAVIKEARDAGIAERTLQRAKSRLKVVSRKGGDGWEWPARRKPSIAPSTKSGGLEAQQHNISLNNNNLGKTAKRATLESVGGLDGDLQPKLNKPSFSCPDCSAVFDTPAGWAQHSVDGCPQ
jgi:hypothetical protein